MIYWQFEPNTTEFVFYFNLIPLFNEYYFMSYVFLNSGTKNKLIVNVN